MKSILLTPSSFCFAFSVILVLFSGCGPRVVNVTGTVTYEGRPAPDVAVCFEHVSGQALPGPAAMGKTDSSGKYTLHLLNESKPRGAMPGSYRVFLRWVDPNPDRTTNVDKPPENPSPYPNSRLVYAFEGVRLEVPNETSVFDFKLDQLPEEQ